MNKDYLESKGWRYVGDGLWDRPGGFIDSRDRKNLVNQDDAIKIQEMIDKWVYDTTIFEKSTN